MGSNVHAAWWTLHWICHKWDQHHPLSRLCWWKLWYSTTPVGRMYGLLSAQLTSVVWKSLFSVSNIQTTSHVLRRLVSTSSPLITIPTGGTVEYILLTFIDCVVSTISSPYIQWHWCMSHMPVLLRTMKHRYKKMQIVREVVSFLRGARLPCPSRKAHTIARGWYSGAGEALAIKAGLGIPWTKLRR